MNFVDSTMCTAQLTVRFWNKLAEATQHSPVT